ncbi:MAG: FG-GAP-like repeat-containing protein [Planctomycetota bacterium]|nr:FG-GAP-like repeat-containing protein [Planctomycetota bacterium]
MLFFKYAREVLVQASGVCLLLSLYAPAVEPFTEEALARGLVYHMVATMDAYGFLGYGCGFADLDNDGDQDIIIIGGANMRIGLFENDGTGHFINRSILSGLPPLPEGSGFAAADYDGDGDLDLYFSQFGLPNYLCRNDGSFHFTDVTDSAGLGSSAAGKGVSFGDFDGDGWVDLYVTNYPGLIPDELESDNILYRNLGDGTFEDVSVEQTVDDFGFGFQSVWFDYDRDGDVDLYLSNDRGHQPPLSRTNQLWRNDDGQLINVSVGSGADVALYSMGLAVGDFDGNRWPDLYVTNIPGGGGYNNPLLLNQGGGAFIEFSEEAGVGNPFISWGAIFFDFDNETHLDLYVNNHISPNTLFQNNGSFPCTEIGAQAGVKANTGSSFSSAVADVDNDGDLDLLVNNLDGNVELFINHEGELRNWIKYRMVGQWPNVFAIGGNVDTRVGEVWQFREILAGGNSYLGQNELVVHVGLDDATIVDEVVVSWPGGETTRTLTDLPANQTWSLYAPDRLGDADGDDLVNIDDFVIFASCYAMPFAPGCEMMDFDGSSVVDLADFGSFLGVFDGTPADCNDNGIPDMEEILLDPSLDADGDGGLDECDCTGDLDGSGDVGAFDLALLLGAWGPCEDCSADLNGDGQVGAFDLALLLGGWGSCL